MPREDLPHEELAARLDAQQELAWLRKDCLDNGVLITRDVVKVLLGLKRNDHMTTKEYVKLANSGSRILEEKLIRFKRRG